MQDVERKRQKEGRMNQKLNYLLIRDIDLNREREEVLQRIAALKD